MVDILANFCNVRETCTFLNLKSFFVRFGAPKTIVCAQTPEFCDEVRLLAPEMPLASRLQVRSVKSEEIIKLFFLGVKVAV